MIFKNAGFVIERGLVDSAAIAAIRRGIFEIMRPYCAMDPADPAAIDRGFLALGDRSATLKRNCYRLFGKLAAVPRLLHEPGVARIIDELGFTDATIQSFSVFCLEPGNRRNAFLPHQDLRDRTSLRALQLWLPLSAGPGLGGMAVFEGTHRSGPVPHGITEQGKPFIDPAQFSKARRIEIVDFAVGDIVFMDPYLIHESIPNTGEGVRWTAVIKLDSVRGLTHLEAGLEAFPIGQFIDLRTNEERLKAG